MKIVAKHDYKSKSICLTAYKALLLLKYFIVYPLSKEEIKTLFKNDKIIEQECSWEMLRTLLNSLKECGCIFSRPSSSKNYKYELIKNPFSLKLTKKEVDLLNKFRKNLCVKSNWQTIINLNSLFDKICLAINDKDIVAELKHYALLSNIDSNLIFELQKYCQNQNRVIFEYLSGKKLVEFELVTSFLKFEKGRLYIWGYSPKYDDFSYIRVDKIKSAKIVNISNDKKIPQKLKILYKMYKKDYVLDKNEILKEEIDEYLLIEYTPDNKFYAIQRFLEMGSICEVISPDFVREEIITTLKAIIERYNSEE